MTCCCPHDVSAGKFFSFFARRYRKRFARKGFEPSQQQLLAGIEQAGFSGATLLEIGSGVGHLHQSLLERGAARAEGVDLASRMIAEARQWANERGLSDRISYLEGDVIALQDQIASADIVILDKVVCCYPYADQLMQVALNKTRRVIALTYPRDRWYVRLGVALAALAMRLVGSHFRPYLHDPRQVEQWVTEAGFGKTCEASTLIWLTQVYEKEGVQI